MGKRCLRVFSVIFNRIFVKLADNEDRHKISDKIEFGPGRNFTMELLALEGFLLTLNGENGVSIFPRLLWIQFIKLTGKRDRHKISDFWISVVSDQSFWSYMPLSGENKWCLQLYNGEYDVSTFSQNSFFIKLTGNKDRHKILNRFEFRPDLTSHFGVTCLSAVKENDVSSFSQSPLFRYLSAGNKDRHKSSNEFEFGPGRTFHYGVSQLHVLWIQSPSNLQITRTGIKSWTSSNFGHI